MPPHPLTNFEIQKYYQNELKLNDVYTRNILSKIKHGAYIKTLDKYESTGTDWMALYVNAKSLTYVDNFGVEHIPKEIRKFIENKKVATNIYRIQAYSIIKYEIRNYLIEEINQNKLMNKKYKNVCRVFNYTDHSLIVVSTITGCVSISAFACLVGIQ